MDNCIFCKIVKGDIPADKVYEDQLVMAFNDINPVAPTHILIIPKAHIVSANEIDQQKVELIGHLIATAVKIAKKIGIDQSGYRLVNNCGTDGGQTVDHLHVHLLGGRSLQWPPG